MASRIEETIAEIEEYIASCKFQTLSNTKIIVNKEELEELLDELRQRTPEEIRRYQRIINNKDAILADAQEKADEIVEQAQKLASEMVSEHQILRQAHELADELITTTTNQAQEMLNKATEDSDTIRSEAIEYTDNLLLNLEHIVVYALDASKVKYEGLISSLQNCYDIILENRRELVPAQETSEAPEEQSAEEEAPVESEEEA